MIVINRIHSYLSSAAADIALEKKGGIYQTFLYLWNWDFSWYTVSIAPDLPRPVSSGLKYKISETTETGLIIIKIFYCYLNKKGFRNFSK